MDRRGCKIEDFSMEVDAVEIQQVGQRQMFPVRVFYKDGTLALFKSIPLQTEFYFQLRQRKDWKEKLLAILNQRVKEELVEKIRSKQMVIDDKLDFIELGPNAIT